MIRTYLTVTLVDKSWRSPGWKSCASLSPSFPQALRKTLRLSWAKNKTRMRFVHLRRQRIISQEFSGRDTAYNSLLPKFISLEGRHGWGGACVQQIRSGPVQSARKHRLVGEAAAWQRLTDSSKATCGLGFGWGPSQNQEAWHQDYTHVTHQMGQWEYKYDTRRNRAAAHALKLLPPMHAKPFPCEYLWYVWVRGLFWRHWVATKHKVRWQNQFSWSQQTERNRNTVSVFPDCVKFISVRMICIEDSKKTVAVPIFELEHVSNP